MGEGLLLAELDQTAELLATDRAQLAGILDTSLRTLQRKAEADGRLGPAASDRLARIKRIHELATHVLGERDKASRWLTAASRGLGGEVQGGRHAAAPWHHPNPDTLPADLMLGLFEADVSVADVWRGASERGDMISRSGGAPSRGESTPP